MVLLLPPALIVTALFAQDDRRMLHAVYRVGDLDATLDYYKKHFGMKQIRYRDVPDVSAAGLCLCLLSDVLYSWGRSALLALSGRLSIACTEQCSNML